MSNIGKVGDVACAAHQETDESGLTIVDLQPEASISDYIQAMAIANNVADDQLDEHMMLSWYDRDRDFESPQHASECHAESAIPGYVDYGINHGATLKIDIEQGRFVFFYIGL